MTKSNSIDDQKPSWCHLMHFSSLSKIVYQFMILILSRSYGTVVYIILCWQFKFFDCMIFLCNFIGLTICWWVMWNLRCIIHFQLHNVHCSLWQLITFGYSFLLKRKCIAKEIKLQIKSNAIRSSVWFCFICSYTCTWTYNSLALLIFYIFISVTQIYSLKLRLLILN